MLSEHLRKESGTTSSVQSGQMSQRLAAAQARIGSLEMSWSWRVTAPLRVFGSRALRVRTRFLENARKVVKLGRAVWR